MKAKILKTGIFGLMMIVTLVVSITLTKNIFINIKYLYGDAAGAKAITCLTDMIQ